jgi:REP element-mobilizing transposase RayT
MRRGVARLRGWDIGNVLRHAFVHGCRYDAIVDGDRMLEFRICQFSIQSNHIHLICEATDNEALARGIQGWAVRIARGVNRFLGRRGSVFEDRYHLRVLKTPTHTRHSLCYVLQNARRHGETPARYNGIDPFSSAWWFDGWRDQSWRMGIPPPPMRTVAEPRTWLLREGWKLSKLGLIAVTEVPPAGRH